MTLHLVLYDYTCVYACKQGIRCVCHDSLDQNVLKVYFTQPNTSYTVTFIFFISLDEVFKVVDETRAVKKVSEDRKVWRIPNVLAIMTLTTS